MSTAARVGAARRPWRLPVVAFSILRRWWRLVRRARALARLEVDAVLVGYLGVFDIHLARWLFDAPIVLDHMAPLGGIAADRSLPFASVLRWFDDRALETADVVLWDTEEHKHSYGTDGAGVVVRVGAPSAWFESPIRELDDDAPLRVCFFGLFTPLQGTTVIAEAIRELVGESIEWTLIGDGQDRSAVETILGHGIANLTWIDWLPPGELVAEVAQHDVCLGIFGTTTKASVVVPNKVFQGAAAGCAIVTAGTPPQLREFDGAALFVPPGDANALAAAIRSLVHDRAKLRRLRSAARDLAEAEFSPRRLAAQLDGALDLALASRGYSGSKLYARRTHDD